MESEVRRYECVPERAGLLGWGNRTRARGSGVPCLAYQPGTPGPALDPPCVSHLTLPTRPSRPKPAYLWSSTQSCQAVIYANFMRRLGGRDCFMDGVWAMMFLRLYL